MEEKTWYHDAQLAEWVDAFTGSAGINSISWMRADIDDDDVGEYHMVLYGETTGQAV